MTNAAMNICVFNGVENIVEKENAGYQYFLLFPHGFQNPSHAGLSEVGTILQRVNPTIIYYDTMLYLYKSEKFADNR